MSDKIKLARFSNVVPFGPGPGVREVQGSQQGVSMGLEPGLLVLKRVVKDGGGNMVHTTKVPLAHCTCLVFEPQREQLVSDAPLAMTFESAGEAIREGHRRIREMGDAQLAKEVERISAEDDARAHQTQSGPEESPEPTSEIVLEGAEKPVPSPATPAPAATPAATKKAKAEKPKK
jgi:hypothetical protein